MSINKKTKNNKSKNENKTKTKTKQNKKALIISNSPYRSANKSLDEKNNKERKGD
jgi:hypothetical protein